MSMDIPRPTRFRRHADLIIEQAVDTLFPYPPPDKSWTEGYLAGIEDALRAIGAEISNEQT